jgi:UDP-glucose 4-epimerase
MGTGASRLLVTGGAGYVGSVVASELIAAGHRVTVLDALSTGHAGAVPSGAELVRAPLVEAGRTLAGYAAAYGFSAVSLRYFNAAGAKLAGAPLAGGRPTHLRALDWTGAEQGHLVCNLGSGAGASVREVAETVRRVTGRPTPTVDGVNRPGDPAVLVAADAWEFARWMPDG